MDNPTRRQMMRGIAGTAAGLVLPDGAAAAPLARRPRAITMWDFSWLERRWPGAGYEDWDEALDALVDRGYDAIRIEAYPHLIAAGAERAWRLKPVWDTQDWGAPSLVEVQVLPALIEFLTKCCARRIKVGLSSWYREDEADTRKRINGPDAMATAWLSTLGHVRTAGLLDTLLYVDLCNEWPHPAWAPFVQPEYGWGNWYEPAAIAWMRAAIGAVRAEYPDLPLLFSTDNGRGHLYAEHDLGFIDAIDHHQWMAGENDDEFYKIVGYGYERFSPEGYRNLQLKGAETYRARPAYWQKLLTDRIQDLAEVSVAARLPMMSTECWAVVDYKDWPMLPWDWVMELCAIGTLAASASGRWLAIATSNFCGPQFVGMWRDLEWHRRLTSVIKAGPIDPALARGRLWARL